jgi:Ca-activated chloride channel family protein
LKGNGIRARRASLPANALAAGILTILALGFAPPACPQDAPLQSDTTIRVDVRLVRVLATVKDPAGALVGSLDKSAFSVTDNGVPQEIAVFERQTEQPLSVAILIDNSGSTAIDLPYETGSVMRFTRALLREGNANDAVALFSFNWEIIKQRGFTRNASAIDKSLRVLRGEAGTSLYDAILLASRDIEDREGRKVLVIVTDGGDTTSHTDFNRAVEAAQLADAIIFPILVVPITNDAGRNIGGENALTTMALRTGGRVFAPSPGAALDRAFDEIIRSLRTQYLLGFYPRNVPPRPDRFHSLQVSVTDPKLQVAARNGYYGEARQETGAATPGGVQVESPDATMRGRKPAPASKAPAKETNNTKGP